MKLDEQDFIDSFVSTVDIVPSKQLPRKVVLRSYKKDFIFLLKGQLAGHGSSSADEAGNEDLRGDERIMQLFGLINTLLNSQADAFTRNLHLLPYAVVPLCPTAGMISWVSNTQQ